MEGILTAVGGINRLLIYFGGAVATIFIAWAGFQYMMAAGDPQRQGVARNALIGAVVGVVIMGLAFLVPPLLSQEVIEPAGGEALLTEMPGINCDGQLQALLINTTTANNKARVEALVDFLQGRNRENCGAEMWDPEIASAVHGSCTAPTGFVSSGVFQGWTFPQALKLSGNAFPGGTGHVVRRSRGDIIVHFDKDHPPADGAHCWVYHSRLGSWQSVAGT